MIFYIKKKKTRIIRLIDGYIWGKCIRTNIYKKTLNVLGEKIYKQYMNFGEDRIVNFVLFKTANSFKFIEEYGIIYIYNPVSIFNSYNKQLITHDELINLKNIYEFTKKTKNIKILLYEIKFRWNKIIQPGLNEENKNNFKYLIELLLKSNNIGKKDKIALSNYLEEIKY